MNKVRVRRARGLWHLGFGCTHGTHRDDGKDCCRLRVAAAGTQATESGKRNQVKGIISPGSWEYEQYRAWRLTFACHVG
jgi:hypothetical protein